MTKKWKIIISILFLISAISVSGWIYNRNYRTNYNIEIGQAVDSLNHVMVYYNGDVGNTSGRNLTIDNYNLGKKYQCVEFVKRYYYEHLNHKMPDSYGHAKDFFNRSVKDGQINEQRNLIQYTNPSYCKPQISDLIIFDGTAGNKYGHVAIISNVTDREIEIVQQNPGKFGKSRITIPINYKNDKWEVDNSRILGWLRKDI